MEDTRIYTGVTKYKNIEFTFVFNGEDLRLIPTTENVKKIANYDTLLQSYQKLIQTKNEPKAENNGVYQRYQNPVVTSNHIP